MVPRDQRTLSPAGLATENRLALLEPLKKANIDFDPYLRFFLTDEERTAGEALLRGAGINPEKKTVVLGLYGSTPNKTYPEDYMDEVLRHLLSHYPVQVVLNYYPDQQAMARAFFVNSAIPAVFFSDWPETRCVNSPGLSSTPMFI